MFLEVNLVTVAITVGIGAFATIVLASVMLRQVTPLKCRRLYLWLGWLMNHLELCHRLYIRSRRPHRIILMRHAESEGNVDKGVYTSTPDHALKITDLGKRQAAIAGRELKNLIGDESVNFIVSPYTRTRMTYAIVREELGSNREFAMKEDPRLRELDFGNFQDLETMNETMETRKAYGRFWFRFMNGESGADVYDRATAFWESVFRSMDHNTGRRFDNYVIITHGLMMRLILMRYFQWKVDFFERVWNPNNCETWVMERDERGSYRVVTEILDKPALITAAAVALPNGSHSPDASTGRSVIYESDAFRAGTGMIPSVLPAALGGQDTQANQTRSGKRPSATGAMSVPAIIGGRSMTRTSTLGAPEAICSSEAEAIVTRAVAGVARCVVDEGAAEDRDADGCADPERCRSVSGAGREAPLPTSQSALNLRDGGYAPGEEGCGRDEEL